MPNPMTGAGYGKDKKDVENYSKPTPPKRDDGRAGFSKAVKDRAAIRKAYKGKDDSIMSRSKMADMAYQKSYVAKGEKASDRMRAKPVKMGNVTTYEGSLYQKRQQAFLKKMQEMNKRNAPKN
jgi:hypothetical protein